MAGGRNARGDEIYKFHTSANAVHRIDEINVGQRLANHRTIRLRWFLFNANLDYRIPHVQRAVNQIQKGIIADNTYKKKLSFVTSKKKTKTTYIEIINHNYQKIFIVQPNLWATLESEKSGGAQFIIDKIA